MIVEWFLVINACMAFLMAIVNFAVFIRRETIGDYMPIFYVADIANQQKAKNLNLHQLEQMALEKKRAQK